MMKIQENINRALIDSIISGNTLNYRRDKADGIWLRYDALQLVFTPGEIILCMFLEGIKISEQKMEVVKIKEGESITVSGIDGYLPIKIVNT